MRNIAFVGAMTAIILIAAQSNSANAACRESGGCVHVSEKKAGAGKSAARKTAVLPRKRAHAVRGSGIKTKIASTRSGVTRVRTASQARVVSLITSMAPSQGVPTWFALKIAKVESGYNSHLRGRAGEYGVYQLKCQTARGIGFSGNCSALLDPAVNVRYGLRHLALAMKSSRGNLRLAASKHNGGLGRKTMIAGYVAKIF